MASSDYYRIKPYLSVSRNHQSEEPICCLNRSRYIPKLNTLSNIASIIWDGNFRVVLCELLWASGWVFGHGQLSLFNFFVASHPTLLF